MSTYNIIGSTTLETINCPSCGGIYAISQDYKNEAWRLGGFKQCWTCPYCKTSRGFGEGEIDKLNKQILRLRENNEWLEKRRDYHAKEAEHFRKSRDGMKGALVKQTTRIKNGVCPCCKRMFHNLARHMKSKHPKFSPPIESKE